MLDTALTGEQALCPWESYYLLAVNKTSCQPDRREKEKIRKKRHMFLHNNLTPFWGKKGSYKWDAEVKNMFGTQ